MEVIAVLLPVPASTRNVTSVLGASIQARWLQVIAMLQRDQD